MNEPQVFFLVIYVFCIVIILLFHDALFMKPLRLLTTFLHEMSHAIACWMTCGDVRAIRVYENEGGVTSYVGGMRLLIIPAGYVGAAIWGSLFVMLSGGQRTSTVAAGMLVGILLFSLCFAPNRTMVCLNLFWAIVTGICVYVEWRVFTPILAFVVLWYGAFVSIHAIFDTYRDTVKRTVLHSDSYACYEECPCCMPRCVGVQWSMCNIMLQLTGIWVAMVQLSDECQNAGWWECISNDASGEALWKFEENAVHTLENWLHW